MTISAWWRGHTENAQPERFSQLLPQGFNW